MIPTSMSELWRSRLQEQQDEDTYEVTQQGHDLILRYSIVGIFAISFISALWITKVITMPLVAGIIFGLVFGPLTDRLVRGGLPHGVAAGLIVLAITLGLLLLGALLAAPFAIWADQLPQMVAALQDKLAVITGFLRRIEGMAGNLTPQAGTPRVAVAEGSPIFDIAVNSTAAASGLLIFIATIYFYLASRRRLKARVLRLCLGRDARQMAGTFFELIEGRIAAYFGVVTVINLGMGLATGLIAWLGGLPFPILWAVGAFVLNYIAFVGPAIVTALLFGAGLLDEGTLWQAMLPAAAYFLVGLIEGNFLTPLAVGRRLTLSPFLVFTFFLFWLWLWGPVGAILSTPILIVAHVAFEVLSASRAAAAAAEPIPAEAERVAEEVIEERLADDVPAPDEDRPPLAARLAPAT